MWSRIVETTGKMVKKMGLDYAYNRTLYSQLLLYKNILIYIIIKLGAKLRELISTMNVQGGGIILYCKTRWTTSYKSISDIIRLRLVLIEVCKIYKVLFIIIII